MMMKNPNKFIRMGLLGERGRECKLEGESLYYPSPGSSWLPTDLERRLGLSFKAAIRYGKEH